MFRTNLLESIPTVLINQDDTSWWLISIYLFLCYLHFLSYLCSNSEAILSRLANADVLFYIMIFFA